MPRFRALLVVAGLLASCQIKDTPKSDAPESNARPERHRNVQDPPPKGCALIETDDDIPSGSATAGALYVGEDELGRRLLTSDVISVGKGFRAAGYECVIVADSHLAALDHERLREAGYSVLTPDDDRWRWPFFGIAAPEVEIAAMVGFHARAGAPMGFRHHTANPYVKRVLIGGTEAGEVGIASLGFAGAGIRFVLVVGGEGALDDARRFVPQAKGVAVRWHDDTGETRFLTESEAPEILRRAAQAAAETREPALAHTYPLQLRVDAKRSRTAADAARRAKESLKDYEQALGEAAGDLNIDFVVEGRSITWTANDPAAAYLSLVVVTYSLMPPSSTSALISQGYQAWEEGRYEEALEAYDEVLELDPYDVDTQCRVGLVHLSAGSPERALPVFAAAVEYLDDVQQDVFRGICLSGHARVLAGTGRTTEAIEEYRRVLEIPDQNGSHAAARKALERLGASPVVR